MKPYIRRAASDVAVDAARGIILIPSELQSFSASYIVAASRIPLQGIDC